MYRFLPAIPGPRRGWGIAAIGLILVLGGLGYALSRRVAGRPSTSKREGTEAAAVRSLSLEAESHVSQSSPVGAERHVGQWPPAEAKSHVRRTPSAQTDSRVWQSPYEEVESYTWHAGTKEIESLCSTCHLLPTPNVEPKSLWPDKIEQMYGYMRGPRPIPPDRMPPIERVIDYWASQRRRS